MKGDLGYIEEHLQVRLVFRAKNFLIAEAERNQLSKLANELTGTLRRDSTFAVFKKNFLYFAFAFDREYEEKLILIQILDVVKAMMGSDFLIKK